MTKFRLESAPFNPSFRGNPQEVFDAIADRLAIYTDTVGFSASTTQPVGNDGPWVNADHELMVWDETISTYVPLDFSASYIPPFWVGPSPPDSELFQLWVKTTSSASLGIYYWNGTAWVTQATGLVDGSVTTIKIADLNVTTRKILNGSIQARHLAQAVPFNKWTLGAPGEFLRWKANGGGPEWRSVNHSVFEIPIASGPTWANNVHTLEHNLGEGVFPTSVQVTAIFVAPAPTYASETSGGIALGDELHIDWHFPAIVVNGENIRWSSNCMQLVIYANGHLAPIDNAHWRFRVRYTAP